MDKVMEPIYTRNNISGIMHECLSGNFPDQEPEPPTLNVFQRLGNWVVGLVR